MKNYKIISFLLLGIGVRLFYSLFFTQMLDFDNILVMSRSVAETGSMVGGVNALVRVGFNTQLYGKIYYQTIGLWLHILDSLGFIRIAFLFDTKPFTDYTSYLIGLWQWSPPVYQITLIKLIQLVWDMFFVFFLYLNARVLNKKYAYLAIFFWAIAPYLMMINYSFFMPDILMLACLLGGTFFWMSALKKTGKSVYLYTLLSLFFLVLGAIIKQLPLLLIPILIITMSKNIKSMSFYGLMTIVFYFICRQDWSGDSYLINTNFMFSHESTAILSNTFNSVPYLFYFYGFFVLFLLRMKKNIFENPGNIILITLSTILIVYINDPVSFIQFAIWFLPFAFLYALYDNRYTWIFLLATISILIKGWNNDVYLSLLLSPTIGTFFNNTMGNEYFAGHIMDYKIYKLVLQSGIMFIYAVILFEVSGLLFKGQSIFSGIFLRFGLNKLKIHNIIILGAVAYVCFVGIDFYIKSHYVLLPQRQFQVSDDHLPLSQAPIIVHFTNPQQKQITALEIPIMQKGNSYGETIFDFRKNGKSFMKIPAYDRTLPVDKEQPLKLVLPKPFTEKNFDLYIYKPDNVGSVVVFKSKILNGLNFSDKSIFAGYEKPDESELIKVKFDSEIFSVFVHGVYDYRDILRAFRHHANSTIKKLFFSSYIAGAFILLLSSGLVYAFGSRLDKKQHVDVL